MVGGGYKPIAPRWCYQCLRALTGLLWWFAKKKKRIVWSLYFFFFLRFVNEIYSASVDRRCCRYKTPRVLEISFTNVMMTFFFLFYGVWGQLWFVASTRRTTEICYRIFLKKFIDGIYVSGGWNEINGCLKARVGFFYKFVWVLFGHLESRSIFDFYVRCFEKIFFIRGGKFVTVGEILNEAAFEFIDLKK